MEIHVIEEEDEGLQDLCRILTFQINHIHISIHIVPKNLLAAVVQFSMLFVHFIEGQGVYFSNEVSPDSH